MSFIREPEAEPIPGYRLIEPLGSGGFGEVWKCVAPGGIFKAIKFVFGNLNALDMEGARAEQELKALERVKEIRHPFVLSMDRIEVVEGELVIVMELADKSLHDAAIEAQAAGLVGIPRESLLRYLRDAAEALDHMNEKYGLQHLDIKPRNLFLVSDRCKVADFGLVKHLERATASGVLSGVTPLYAPPETFTGKIYPSTDQYSLAIVYQEMLTGQRPFNGKNARVLAQQHMQAEPDLRTLPEAERPVVARALSKDHARRFPNCMAFVRALYTARAASKPDMAGPQVAEPSFNGQRPRTMVDTLDNISLEQLPEGDDGWVNLDEPTSQEEVPQSEVSQLGVTVAQPQTGTLRPTLVIGLGGFGRRALVELRCRLIDRFGSLDQLPMLRFLYVDPDPDAIKAGTRGGAEVAFRPSEVYQLPLQPVAHYRRRQMEQLNDWLPREKLYALPRSLKTQGSRALGRLAFADNYLRLITRLRREVQQAAHPDAIYQSVSQTGLALRDNVPRVYVIAAAAGGSSGFLVDLGYAVRRLLHQLRYPESPVTALVFCGAPEDPATPAAELANVHATLTELNHFSDPSIPFHAQYAADGPRLQDQGPPFDAVYLMPLAHRSPEAVQANVAHLGSYLFHEMTTPLGLRLDQLRRTDATQPPPTPFRSMGTYAVWFPRGLLLRLAARSACARLLEDWMAVENPDLGIAGGGERSFEFAAPSAPPRASEEVEAACARALAEPGLRPESLSASIEDLARSALDALPAEALTRLLGALEEQSAQGVAQDDPAAWTRNAVTRVREWLGPGLTAGGVGRETGEWRRSKLTRALEAAAAQLARDWDARLHEVAVQVMEAPGQRVAAAEAALARLVAACDEAAAVQEEHRNQCGPRVRQAQDQLQQALDACSQAAGGFSLFGSGSARRRLRVFLDHLAAFARQCLAEDLATAVYQFYVALGGRLRERLREMSFCRQRLRHLQEQLTTPEESLDTDPASASELTPNASPPPSAETFWESIRQSQTTRVVLPLGESELESAAARFLGTLTQEQWRELDVVLQDRVLGPGGGLHRALAGASDLTRSLVQPLLEQTSAFLGDFLPTTDVAQVLMEGAAGVASEAPQEQVLDFIAHAAPLVESAAQLQSAGAAVPRSNPEIIVPGRGREKARPEPEQTFLLVPASEPGKAYGEQAKEAAPNLQVVRVPGQAALMVCRERDWLPLEPLSQLLGPCRRAYGELAVTPPTSPHSRSDITDWIPLDP